MPCSISKSAAATVDLKFPHCRFEMTKLDQRWDDHAVGRTESVPSIRDDVVVSDQPVRGHVDQETAIGFICDQAIVNDPAHDSLVSLNLASRHVLVREEDDGLDSGQVGMWEASQVGAYAWRQRWRIGYRLSSLAEGSSARR